MEWPTDRPRLSRNDVPSNIFEPLRTGRADKTKVTGNEKYQVPKITIFLY